MELKRGNSVQDWVNEAIDKGYSVQDLRGVLLKNKYTYRQIIEVLKLFEKLSRKTKKPDVEIVSPAPSLVQIKKPTPIEVTAPFVQKPIEIKPIQKSPFQKPQISFQKQLPKKEAKRANSIDTYEIVVDKAKVEVRIEKTNYGLRYSVYLPEIDIATRALLEEIRKELVSITAIAIGEIVDQKSVMKIKERFMVEAGNILSQKLPSIQPETKDFLIGVLMQDMLGLGKIEFLINDLNLEEIVIVNSKEIRIYHKKYGWLLTNIKLTSEDEVTNYANIIARRVGRQISVLNPLLDAHMVTGDRSNAVLYPIATKGNTITIRKFARDPWTIIDLIQNNTLPKDVAAMLWLAIEYEMNILFSGGTASGKTVALNSCMPFIPPNHRVISMEDTRELMLPKFLYWCPLVTRTANVENKGEVSMLDLLVNSLRMRPDRIILGEIRRQQEAEVLFEAMHTGHSVYSTVHADTANETIRRLINPPINIPPSMLNSVNLNVVMFRDRRKGVRRAFQLAEFIPGKETLTANLLYRWVPEKDIFVAHNKSLSFFDELSRNTGMDEREIETDLKKKKAVFDWLIKNKIRDLQSFGKLMNYYYTDRERMWNIIKNNDVASIVEQKKPEF